MGHHAFFQSVELLLGKVLVNFAPEHFVLAARLTHNSFVFGSAPGVFARVDNQRTMIRKNTFITSGNLFVKFGCNEIPIDASRFSNTVILQLIRSILATQVFRFSFRANGRHSFLQLEADRETAVGEKFSALVRRPFTFMGQLTETIHEPTCSTPNSLP